MKTAIGTLAITILLTMFGIEIGTAAEEIAAPQARSRGRQSIVQGKYGLTFPPRAFAMPIRKSMCGWSPWIVAERFSCAVQVA